ncbi:LysM peptidoglycan-binding domain-containing protein [Actinotalea sp. K2]|uniref:LysM peptidoglycan-binding domain-containing protein n=1 Tax=Actinotalea sp. K2 TaxID=2939438 RepID=UPI0020171820|nr:LysM peptidoglycan-binding domain-containing protein [Actinotalea sp. K2]MCL3860152.1 LysM peptidoglycan-binding domain-containing protein [Actinotalea sp. K2]
MSTIAMDTRAMTGTAWRAHRTAAPAGGLRLTARGRLVVICLTAAVVVAGMLGGGRAEAGAVGPGTQVTTHTVVGGETLWGIARSVSAPGQDLRDAVDDLVALNGLSSSALRVGQQIVVPVD